MQIVNNNSKQADRLLDKALEFDLTDVTERYIDTYKVSHEIAKLHEEECKKYLLLCSLFPEKGLGMKGIVDNYWHTFLLFTKDYTEFCNQIGSSFIHHVPNTKKHVKKNENSFATTMELYKLTFGHEPNPNAWFYSQGKFASDCDSDDRGCSDGPGPGDCSPGKDCNGEDSSGSGN